MHPKSSRGDGVKQHVISDALTCDLGTPCDLNEILDGLYKEEGVDRRGGGPACNRFTGGR